MIRLLAPLSLIALALPLSAQDKKVDFAKSIWPIFERHCIECHSAEKTGDDGRVKKPKGHVELDSKDGIIKSKRGKLIKAGDPEDSLLFEVITLEADNEDLMPPPDKGTPLTKKQIDLIERWISEGGDYGKWRGNGVAASDKPPAGSARSGSARSGKAGKPGESPWVALAKGLKPVAEKTLAGLGKGPFKVTSIGDGSPLLVVTCYGNSDGVDDHAIEELLPLAANIAELNLAATQITDQACSTIAKMPALLSLDLRRTAVGNHGTAELAACKELRSLNLYGSKVGDYGLTALATLKHLEQLYVWQTEVTASGVLRVRESIPGVKVVDAADLPEPMEQTENRGRRRRK
ncbi:MAG: hypothetical protein KDC98_03745 [Planctomycetes bacterium]|nr:hypothetical protein [Planctomycetota bacterium]